MSKPLVTEAQKRQYRDDGYMILERVIPPDLLTLLREECSYFLGYKDALLDAAGQTTDGITHRGSRYFIGNYYRLSARMWRFLFSPVMAEIAQAALGPNVYLFHEQWVVKGAEQGMKFGWHQDSGYITSVDKQSRHKPYLTCWCPLDDVTEENGTVSILPHARGGTRAGVLSHQKEIGTNDLIGYQGDDPGLPVTVPAGSVVAFTSLTLHRSGANTTSQMRRVHLPQYSSEPILSSTGKLWALAVPFVKDGRIVYDPATDTPAKYGPKDPYQV